MKRQQTQQSCRIGEVENTFPTFVALLTWNQEAKLVLATITTNTKSLCPPPPWKRICKHVQND